MPIYHGDSKAPSRRLALFTGAAAFAAMWRVIPLLRPLGLLARNHAILGLLERLYMRFLTLRPALLRLLP